MSIFPIGKRFHLWRRKRRQMRRQREMRRRVERNLP